ncbi:uncharacterized protein FIESC28_09808 [Fusarium coffeatum]|uniref:Uncharacterized protein n=1 Tax=Fusarium coffeatum TaxID=231269 RepID=A0A366QXF9_9HYPO|nr:uncharacterized protein FIESC28_09808 [Fusarium coffeatum]RBR09589.1 hypothetical protein FIESC28_09808 [Fusarium coffeatum]
MKTTTALLTLAAVAESTPLFSKRHTDDVFESKEKMCKGWDLRTAEGVDKLWTETDAGIDLELFINIHPEHQNNWLKNLEDRVMGGTDGKSGAAGCAVIGGNCNPMGGIGCEKQFEKYGTTFVNKNSYWVFQSVKGMHGKFAELHRQLTTETLVSGLKIPNMVDEFEGKENKPDNMKGWLSAAATMGNALGGLVPGGSQISAGLGLMAGLMSGLSLSDDEDNGAATVSAGLADLFKAASVQLEDTLRIATGGGRNEDEYNSLPAPKWDTYQTKIAKLFNGGWFLLDDDVEAVRVTLGSITNNIQKKVANDVMKSSHLYLVADKLGGKDSREKCGFSKGRQWLPLRDGEEYCWYIMRNDPKATAEGAWREVKPDIYDKMASYGLGDRETYYKALIDCALNGDNKVQTDKLVQGEIPRCFFNMPAVFVTHNSEHGCGSPFDNHKCDYRKSTPLK